MDAVRSLVGADRVDDAFEHAPIATGILRADGRVERANLALVALLAGPAGAGVAELIDRHAPRVLQRGRRRWHAERRVRDGAGGWAWFQLHVARLGTERTAVVQVIDVTAAHERVAELQKLADHEPLTGLWNRRRFDQELVRQLSRCHRHGECAVLAILDVDGLKAVNDRLGHKGGDAVIVHVARALAGRLRASDGLARIGGDEFAALLVSARASDAEPAVRALCAAVAATPAVTGGVEVPVRVSAGFAVLDMDTPSPDAAFVEADASLYAAKERGR